MKRVRLTKVDLFSIGLCLLAILPGLMVYDRLPEEIATHFGLDGEPNGYSSRLFAVIGLPLVVTLIQMVYCITTNLFRKNRDMNRAEKVIRFLFPTGLYAVQIFMLMYSMGKATDIMTFIGVLETVLFLVLGNYLPKVRRTTFFGIRTPHTLSNEEVWDKTHRFAGSSASEKVSLISQMIRVGSAGGHNENDPRRRNQGSFSRLFHKFRRI